jgi:hypothetical protein
MAMEYINVVKDFAERTKRNLDNIRKALQNESQAQVCEVTQLLNSMLGLLLFPPQQYFETIPKIPLSDLEAKGWPKIKQSPDFPEKVSTLDRLMRYLRNAVAHFNMKFLTNDNHQISGVCVWNTDFSGQRIWMAELSLMDLEKITEHSLEMMAQ